MLIRTRPAAGPDFDYLPVGRSRAVRDEPVECLLAGALAALGRGDVETAHGWGRRLVAIVQRALVPALIPLLLGYLLTDLGEPAAASEPS